MPRDKDFDDFDDDEEEEVEEVEEAEDGEEEEEEEQEEPEDDLEEVDIDEMGVRNESEEEEEEREDVWKNGPHPVDQEVDPEKNYIHSYSKEGVGRFMKNTKLKITWELVIEGEEHTIAVYHSQLSGKKVVLLANLAPRKIRGVESHGMLLCAANADDSKLSLLTVDSDMEDGCEIG